MVCTVWCGWQNSVRSLRPADIGGPKWCYGDADETNCWIKSLFYKNIFVFIIQKVFSSLHKVQIEPRMADGLFWRCLSYFSGPRQCYLLGSQWDSHKPPGFHPKYLNPLGARFFFFKCWILTSRFQKLVAWKGLKIEIYCKLEKCWAWPKVYVGCKYTHLICILWRQQGGGPLEFHNIQEIVDIKLMFELICMFVCFFVFLSSFQMIRKEEINNKTGESTKLLLYYYPI